MQSIVTSPFIPHSVPKAWQPIIDGVAAFKTQFDADFNQINKDLSGKLDQMANTVKEKGNLKARVVAELVTTPPSSPTTTVAQPPATTLPAIPAAPPVASIATQPDQSVSPFAATSDIADMKIKVHVEFNDDKMNDLIEARVQEILTGPIVFNNPVGQRYRAGTYRIRFEEASK